MADVAAQFAYALSRLMRGVVHEALNPLNSIVMSAQLAELSLDDRDELRDCLQTIGTTARASGAWWREIGELVSAGNAAPRGEAGIAAALERARGLLGSRARRAGADLQFVVPEDGTARPLNVTAVALAVAFVVETAISAGAGRVAVEGNDAGIAIRLEPASILTDAAADGPHALELARAVCAAHDGELKQSEEGLQLRLA